jgi:hypothetical protein
MDAKGLDAFEHYRFPVRGLDDLRLGTDYRLDSISQDEVQWVV